MRLAAFLVAVLTTPHTFSATRIDSFSPEGTVKQVRQVAARFSVAMVALGDPRPSAPFSIDCAEPGTGRWVDGRHWVFDFERDLPAGVACAFATAPGLVDLDGNPVEAGTFRFDTGGSAVRASLPREGAENIDENPLFVVAPDAAVDAESVAAHARCEISGVGESIPVDVLDDAARASAFADLRKLGYAHARLLRPSGRSDGPLSPEEADRAETQLVLLRCRRSLPPSTEVRLVWGRGIQSASGIATIEDQVLVFRTRPEFSVRFECERVNARADCLPGNAMRLVFTAPLSSSSARSITLVGADATYTPVVEDGDLVDRVVFEGPFPERSRFRVELPEGLTDDVDRPLANAQRFPLEVATDDYPPLAKFSGDFGILESREGGVLPASLRNVEPDLDARGIPGASQRIDDDAEIVRWLEKVKQARAPRGEWIRPEDGEPQSTAVWKDSTGDTPVLEQASSTEFAIPREAGADAFEVVGIPLGGPGFYVVELASPRLGAALLGEDRPYYVPTAALVTNLSVHLQWGREASLVWVTSLDEGAPVAGADIRISDYCTGSLLWRGVTDDDGLVRIEPGPNGPALAPPHEHAGCHTWHTAPLFVSARQGDELAFTVSSWTDGISPTSFGLPQGHWSGPEIVHTVLDRSLFRAGETVSMKHFVRRHTSAGFDVPGDLADAALEISHAGSGQRYPVALDLDAAGIGASTWAIPADAKLGTYQLKLTFQRGQREVSFWPGSFRVEQYRVPTMRAVIQPPAEPLVNAGSALIDVFLEYLSGGGASGAPVEVRSLVEPRAVSFPDYEDYAFGGDDVVEGTTRDDGVSWYFRDAEDRASIAPARVMPLVLDANGAARVDLTELPDVTTPHDLVVDLEYQDANGEVSTVSRRVPLWPSMLQVGIRTEGWTASEDQLRFRVLVLDIEGAPAARRDITVELFTRTTHSYRKRLVGGYYAYENQTVVERIESTCEGRTNAEGLVSCDVEPGVSGAVVLRASTEDDAGNTAIATREMWVAGEDEWWFAASEGDRMDVLPERAQYEAGDVARLQVRMPFRDATLLVTVAREGVLESFVTELSGSEPVIELPVDGRYAPNMYVSVLAVRGRVGAIQTWLADLLREWDLPWKLDGGSPTALVDLSKPAYKLGFARLDVGWAPHRLDVAVTPTNDTFKVRDTARVRVKVQRADGGALPADAELALAAVDRGLLELSPNDSWKLLDAMMNRRGIEVITSTAQMQVVGKRHYGRKAVSLGGGGGHEPARELFDTLLAWHARVPLDADGTAEIDVKLRDALTSYHIVAIASAGLGLFGTGSADIRTTQDLILHPGLPPVVREGDRFSATFTLRNASGAPLRAVTRATVTSSGESTELPAVETELAPGQAVPVTWDQVVPAGADRLQWEADVQTADGTAGDRVRVEQAVMPVHPVRVQQATLDRLDGALHLTAERPSGALDGRGGIELSLRARLGDGLEAVRAYMAAYPYTCFEQRASRAVALQDEAQWNALMSALPTYLDRDGLVRFFPADWMMGEDTLTAYVLSLAHEAGYAIPDATRERMLEGLDAFVEGRTQRTSALPTADLAVRKLAAVAALARWSKADARQLDSFTIEPNLWPTSALLDWLDVLARLDTVPEHDRRRAEAERELRARLTLAGTTLGFSTERSDALPWLMVSPDLNAVRAIVSLTQRDRWREELPRLARGALGRQTLGHWRTTPANAWGVLAMEKFSAAFEATAVTGTTEVQLNGASTDVDWQTPAPSPVKWSWPAGRAAIDIDHNGRGQPWAFVTTRAALPLEAPLFAGYTIERTVTPVEQARPDVFSRGDVVRVRLAIEAQSDATWVVVDDPVPTGATLLGSGLGRDPATLTADDPAAAGVWPAFVERKFDAYRAYYRYVPKGRFELEYLLRLNNPGTFQLPATRVEAMYAPESFGEFPNEPIEVQPAP